MASGYEYIINMNTPDITGTNDILIESPIPLIRTLSINDNVPIGRPILNRYMSIDVEDLPELEDFPELEGPTIFDQPSQKSLRDEHDPPILMPPLPVLNVGITLRSERAAASEDETRWDKFEQEGDAVELETEMPPKMVRVNTISHPSAELASDAENSSAFAAPFFVWEYQFMETNDDWLPCNVGMAMRCEDEYLNKPLDLKIAFNSDEYSIDLLNGTQTNTRTGTMRNIRRRVAIESA
jgi:hypothetical protein